MSTLSAENRKALRLAILVILNNANKEQGIALGGFLGIGIALTMASSSYKGLDGEIVESEVVYLVDKGLAEKVPQALSPEIRHFRITAAGRDHLAEQGLG